jgi:hypothetical protein
MFRTIEVVGSDLELRHGDSAPTIKIGRMAVAGQCSRGGTPQIERWPQALSA